MTPQMSSIWRALITVVIITILAVGLWFFWCDVSSWRWDVIGGGASIISALAALVIIWFVERFERSRRRRRLHHPGHAYFIIPARFHHCCGYAIQDEHEHRLQTIILPSHCELIIDLVVEPSVEFDTVEMAIGCDEEWSKKGSIEFCVG